VALRAKRIQSSSVALGGSCPSSVVKSFTFARPQDVALIYLKNTTANAPGAASPMERIDLSRIRAVALSE
jgi:hypothetical protein